MQKKKAFPARFRFTPTAFAVDLPSYEGDFLRSPFQALYNWGFEPKPAHCDEAGAFLYRIAEGFIERLSQLEELELQRERAVVPLSQEDSALWLRSVPFASGSEYVCDAWLSSVWTELNRCFALEISEYAGTVLLYLAEKSQHLQVADRVFFHLVESPPGDMTEALPFSFMATYSSRDEDWHLQHMPLKYALIEYKEDKRKIRVLRNTLGRAALACPLFASFLRKDELSRPVPLSSKQAYSLLKAIPALEEAGIVCRIPDWWKRKRHAITLSVRLGGQGQSLMGLDSVVGMKGFLQVDGIALSDEEVQELLDQTDGLALIKGRWVEVDHERLRQLLRNMESFRGKISLLDALHLGMNAGQVPPPADEGAPSADAEAMSNGDWLDGLYRMLRSPAKDMPALPETFTATLRPYQRVGFDWLERMEQCGFGACLADDMGLGKTVQVLAYLEALRVAASHTGTEKFVLLIVPASLLGNWQKECAAFAPQMPVDTVHGPLPPDAIIPQAFLTITTYTMAGRLPLLAQMLWDVVILDEAQAIKNPLSKQTRFIKALPSRHRLAMTGTPVENDLTNLWSLFDFLNTGLLGTSGEFKDFCKTLHDKPEGYAKLKGMISPFMLRRLKTDKSIINDLPEKIEMVDYVSLSKKQRVLYKQYVEELEEKLKRLRRDDDPATRRAIVLSSLIKLKQICNHPDQFTGGSIYAEDDSGKFELLRELCAAIYEKRERVLVFTQFKELCAPLDAFLAGIFGTAGFVLHGATPVKKRSQMVEDFQSERYVPYMVISVKAGGTGLTLTNANHVIHFDRWWNPAVENQATDRAFRIGQTKNVIVHKFVCRGTLEEKINELIERKKELADSVIGTGSGEKWISEMDDAELHQLFALE